MRGIASQEELTDYAPQSNRSFATVHLKQLSGLKSADAPRDVHYGRNTKLAGDDGTVRKCCPTFSHQGGGLCVAENPGWVQRFGYQDFIGLDGQEFGGGADDACWTTGDARRDTQPS